MQTTPVRNTKKIQAMLHDKFTDTATLLQVKTSTVKQTLHTVAQDTQ